MAKPGLLVVASTYPRWRGDHEPGFVHELSRRLTASFDVHVLCPHAAGALAGENIDGVEVHRFRYAPERWETLVHGGGIIANLKQQRWKWGLVPLFFLSLAWNTWRWTRHLQPSRIHAHWLIPQGLVLAFLRLADPAMPPFLVTVHGADIFALRSPPFPWLKRWVIRQAAALSVVSSPMLAEVEQLGADPARVRVMPMGVDCQALFLPKHTTSRSAGEILFVGRLVEKKGLRHLLQALPQVLARMPQAHLTIAGFGPEETALRELAARLGVAGRVEFLGAVPQHELPGYYQRAALFVAPFVRAESGDQEGLPVALMEAIACHCPPLAGRLAVLADVFLPEEEDFLAQPQDTAEFAEKILALLGNTSGAVARTRLMHERLMPRLDWNRIAVDYAECLKSMAVDKP